MNKEYEKEFDKKLMKEIKKEKLEKAKKLAKGLYKKRTLIEKWGFFFPQLTKFYLKEQQKQRFGKIQQ